MFVEQNRQLDVILLILLHLCLHAGGGEDESGIFHLRELTSGSTPKPVRLGQRGHVQSGDGADAKGGVRNHGETASSLLFAMESTAVGAGGSSGIGVRLLAADSGQRKRDAIDGSITMREVNCERPSSGRAATDCSPFTPTKRSTVGPTTPSGRKMPSWNDCVPPATPVMTPTAPTTRTAEEQVRPTAGSCGFGGAPRRLVLFGFVYIREFGCVTMLLSSRSCLNLEFFICSLSFFHR